MAEHFVSSIKKGNQGEQLVVDLFEMHGYKCEKNKENKSLYDYLVTKRDKQYKLEVKSDFYASKSGNICFEFYNPKTNKASGVTVTEADFWVHLLFNPTKILICKTTTLHSFLDSVPPLKKIKKAGDGNSALLLYTIDTVLTTFDDITQIDNLDKVLK